MISRVRGTLVSRDTDRIEIATSGGLVYEVEVPVTVAGRLPAVGADVEIRTAHVVREDSATLYGFLQAHERELFLRLMGATGVGARLALSMLSTYTAERLARALAEKDVTALKQVSGVGKKTAERIVLELADRVQDLVLAPGDGDGAPSSGSREAVSALVALGYSFAEADGAVRQVLDEDEAPGGTEELIRKALAIR